MLCQTNALSPLRHALVNLAQPAGRHNCAGCTTCYVAGRTTWQVMSLVVRGSWGRGRRRSRAALRRNKAKANGSENARADPGGKHATRLRSNTHLSPTHLQTGRQTPNLKLAMMFEFKAPVALEETAMLATRAVEQVRLEAADNLTCGRVPRPPPGVEAFLIGLEVRLSEREAPMGERLHGGVPAAGAAREYVGRSQLSTVRARGRPTGLIPEIPEG